ASSAWEASQVTSTAWPGRAPVAVASGMERRWQGGLGGPLLPTVGPAIAMIGRRDRKSTRLNSSHVSISYAVFCLKKKKKKCVSRVGADRSMGEDAGSLESGRFHYFPVAPGRMEFAIEVRNAIRRLRPDVVARHRA